MIWVVNFSGFPFRWVANLMETFDIGPDRTRAGVVVYSDEPVLSIALGDYENRKDLVRAVQNISYLEGEALLKQ